MPQKQGTLQFNGSFKSGSRVALAISGERVSTGVGELVRVMVGLGCVAVMVGVNVIEGYGVAVEGEVIIEGSGLVGVGGVVWTAGIHPVTIRIRISNRDDQDRNFIFEPLPRVVKMVMILIP